MSAYPNWANHLSFREIDQRLDLPKGSAFRAFKSIEAGLSEGSDYVLLLAGEDHAAIGALRAQGRVYASSRNVVLLAPAVGARLVTLLQSAR
jgi:hypothetical protein